MSRPVPSAIAAAACLFAATVAPSPAQAWGATGHRLIGQLAVSTLPDNLPAFLRTPQAVEAVGEYAREPDRWKMSGAVHDEVRNAAHFVDIDDGGKVMGGPTLASLPATLAAYEKALAGVGASSDLAGYLPYSIIDGWQQLAKDFAYWRALTAAISREADPERKAWLQRDLARREALTLRDLGVWSHYVGDGSQPMHVSVHYDGWKNYPNPHGYTQDHVHALFEGAFVRSNVTLDQVRTAMSPAKPCPDPIETCVARYLAATQATVEPFYALQKEGGFAGADLARGRAFAVGRLAAGADEARDLVVAAWIASAQLPVGYPPLTVEQVVSGADPYDALYGED
jgi:hypothetical protein